MYYTKLGARAETGVELGWDPESYRRFLTTLSKGQKRGVLYLDLAGNREKPVPINIRFAPSEETPNWVFFYG